MSRTELAYGATPRVSSCYAMSGTDVAYGATRMQPSPSPYRLPSYLPMQLLRDVRYGPREMSATDLAYSAARRTYLVPKRRNSASSGT
eukprot:230854-Rhodomonas_salina.1